jgi:hypothetical protein
MAGRAQRRAEPLPRRSKETAVINHPSAGIESREAQRQELITLAERERQARLAVSREPNPCNVAPLASRLARLAATLPLAIRPLPRDRRRGRSLPRLAKQAAVEPVP